VDEMGRICRTHGTIKKCCRYFTGKNQARRPYGDLGIDRRKVLKHITRQKII
jgi:hypothetical protein